MTAFDSGPNNLFFLEALKYADDGFPVLPLKPGGKEAILKDWPNQASTDSAKIQEWWTENPNANVGLLTGKRSGLLVIDVDEKNNVSGRKSIREAGLNMPTTRAVKTPSGGLHYYYQYPDECSIGSPTSVLDCVDIRGNGGYVVAPPSTFNGEPYVSASKAEIAPLPSQWVVQLMKPREQPTQRETVPICEGGRNNTLTSLGGSMRFKGFSPREIEAALMVANSERCDPPLDPKEVATIARSVGKYAISDHTALVDFSRFKSSAMVNGNYNPPFSPKYVIQQYDGVEPPPPDWQVKGLIECETLIEFFGGWGDGKTFVMLDLLACIATGKDYHDRAVTQGAVVYFCGEGQRGLTRRLRAWEREYGIDLSKHPFYICTTPASLSEEGDVQAVLTAIRDTGVTPVHVCLDTRTRNFGPGDENGGVDMGMFLMACDQIKDTFNCTVSATHHPGHMDKGRGRGHSSWLGALDVSYQVKKTPCGKVSITVAKAPKDFDPPEPFAFQLTQFDLGIIDEDGKAVTSCVLRPLDGLPTVAKKLRGSAQMKSMEVLKKLAREASPSEDASLGLVPAADWKNNCVDSGMSENSFYTARRKLIEKGLIFEVGNSIRVQQ